MRGDTYVQKTKAGFKLLQMKIAQSVNNTKNMKKENMRGGMQGQESGSMVIMEQGRARRVAPWTQMG